MVPPYIFARIPPSIIELLITKPKTYDSEGIPMQAKINKTKQLNIANIYSELEEFFIEYKPKLIRFFEEFIDLTIYIPRTFQNAYYKKTGHPRDFKLIFILSTFVIQKSYQYLKHLC